MVDRARVVIVGGGIVGAATAYHLSVVHGWRDIVVMDQGPLPYNVGSTSHAPGGVVVASHNQTLTRMAAYSSRLYSTLDPVDDKHHVYHPVGGLEVARTAERLEDMKRLHGTCAAWGVATDVLSPAETAEKAWFIDPDAITGSLFVHDSALIRGYHVVGDLLAKARATGGVTVLPETGLADIDVDGGSVRSVVTDHEDHRVIEAEHVVLAANIWSPALADKLGVEIPLMAFQHQYAITPPQDALAEFATDHPDQEMMFPLMRDLDVAMYYRNHWSAMGIGSYNHVAHMVHPRDVGATAIRDFTPEDMVEPWRLAQELVPMLRDTDPEFDIAYNGMFAFSVDGMPIIGESRTARGFWSANASWITHAGGVAKSLTEWMVDGATEWDMRQCHLYRFQDHATTRQYVDVVTTKNYREVYDLVHPRQPITEPRDVRLTPFHDRHLAAGAVFTTFAGFELPNWYESNAALLPEFRDAIPDRAGFAAQYWSPIQGAEHLATRARAGLFDLTGLSIIEVSGPDAFGLAERLCSNVVDVEWPAHGRDGRVVYTCWLTPRGGIKRDLTVARMGADRFWFFVGEGTLPQDLDWVFQHADGDVHVVDISPAYSAVGVFGPESRHILQAVTDSDLDDFDFYRARWIDVAMSRVLAMRISYVGELGWELHVPVDSSLAVWDAIVAAGQEHGLVLAGQGAMDSLRLEKGYRLWGGDIHTEYNVFEAGLGWTAKLDKADFLGRDATAAAKNEVPDEVLSCMTLDDPRAALLGYEVIRSDGEPVGYVTSANRGYSVGTYLAYGYLPADLAQPGTELTIDYFGEPFAAVVTPEPVWDPAMDRMKS